MGGRISEQNAKLLENWGQRGSTAWLTFAKAHMVPGVRTARREASVEAGRPVCRLF